MADLTRADWIAVGMALKEEGFPVSVWDDWSKNDSRYKPGECERLWNGFHGSSNPVRGGTIVKLAQERGWSPFKGEGGCLNWDDSISYDGREDSIQSIGAKENWNPAQDLIRYLETLFDSEDKVAYVTNDVWQNEEGKWAPGRGVWDRTAGQLIAGLKKHPNDVGATMGDWKSEAGAWIRFNPVDGAGVRNENVTRYRYALVESDTLPIEEQYRLYRRLELPIACLVHSGGKSLHAIILDPIYKVITGDENKASDMGAFCNQFDLICSETGCSTIYSHHHSKGAQGAKKAMDRASGSGVFARDPDAQLDMVQLELTEHLKNNVRDGTATAWRLESSLREFPNIEPVDFWFEYPIHRVDDSGALNSVYAEGSPMGNLTKSGKRNTQEDRKASVEMAYNVCSFELPVSLESMAEYMGVSIRCARDRIKECGNEYTIKGGYVVKAEKAGSTEIGK